MIPAGAAGTPSANYRVAREAADDVAGRLSNTLRGTWVFRGDANADAIAAVLAPLVREMQAEAVEAAANSLEVCFRDRHMEAATIVRHYADEHRAGADRLARYTAEALQVQGFVLRDGAR